MLTETSRDRETRTAGLCASETLTATKPAWMLLPYEPISASSRPTYCGIIACGAESEVEQEKNTHSLSLILPFDLGIVCTEKKKKAAGHSVQQPGRA